MPIATFRQFVDLYPFERTRTVYGQCDVFSDEGEHLGIREVKYRDVESWEGKDVILSLRTRDGEVDPKRVEADVLKAVTDQAAAEAQAKAEEEIAAELARKQAFVDAINALDFDMLDDSGKAITGSMLIRDKLTGQIIDRVTDREAAAEPLGGEVKG